MARKYELRQRATQQAETRRRIVDAAVALHQSKGILATTMADVAERAKVGRVTVYRHFQDELALAQACSGQYFEDHPLPDLSAWRAIADPRERLKTALRETYAYHRETRTMMSAVLADARDHPVVQPYHLHWRKAASVLANGWPASGRALKARRAAIALALSFETWRLLALDHRLSDAEAVDVALGCGGVP
jgi:AcrR family transcriptional regulator